MSVYITLSTEKSKTRVPFIFASINEPIFLKNPIYCKDHASI